VTLPEGDCPPLEKMTRSAYSLLMATPWDRAAAGYLDEWVPRFVPYHLDLVRELVLHPGGRVLVTSAGPGSEVLAVARAVGSRGFVRATDKSAEMVRVCREHVKVAAFPNVEAVQADARETGGGPWDAILCAFGLWQMDDRAGLLRAWAEALNPSGKVGILTWGPSDGDGPFEILSACLRELEPALHVPSPHVLAGREPMALLFDEGGLAMVRHTVVAHTLAFKTAEHFVRAVKESCTWRRLWEEVGDARFTRIAALFYERVGGPDAPLSFDSPATIAIGALPGAEIELENRPSLRVPIH
jgi:ubiquinone/menaquinone biosynthesis C-methylase UbiE